VNDALLVRCFERFGNLLRDRQYIISGNRSLCDSIGQCLAFHQLHHEGADNIGSFEAIDLPDVGMVQRGKCLRLAFETRQPVRVVSKVVRQDFDRDLAAKVSIERAIDFAHSALANWDGDLVRTEPSASG
jgi:hypothetical protein